MDDYMAWQEADARDEQAAARRALRERFDPAEPASDRAELLRREAKAAALADLGPGASRDAVHGFVVGYLSRAAAVAWEQLEVARRLLNQRIVT